MGIDARRMSESELQYLNGLAAPGSYLLTAMRHIAALQAELDSFQIHKTLKDGTLLFTRHWTLHEIEAGKAAADRLIKGFADQLGDDHE